MEEVDRKKIEQMFLGRPVECLFPACHLELTHLYTWGQQYETAPKTEKTHPLCSLI
jgi:hypothetical protein